MTVDRSLKVESGMAGSRNVLKRDERIAILSENGDFDPESGSALGLKKTRVRHSRAGGKAKKEEAAAEGADTKAGPAKA